MKVNIPKSNLDTFFRYKRDEIEIKIINANGGNTELMNIKLISDQLNENLQNLIKYIKKKLNTNIIIKNDKYLINKIQEKSELENILEEYIIAYCLCNKCSNPEFTKDIVKKEEIRICKACGASRNYILAV
jgi:translation initiation factor 2 beta subunit (eIF-2beta)/eIF-5